MKKINLCPNCQNTINDRSDLKRCMKCFHLTCPACNINDVCIDCHVSKNVKTEISFYNKEKYGITNEI